MPNRSLDRPQGKFIRKITQPPKAEPVNSRELALVSPATVFSGLAYACAQFDVRFYFLNPLKALSPNSQQRSILQKRFHMFIHRFKYWPSFVNN